MKDIGNKYSKKNLKKSFRYERIKTEGDYTETKPLYRDEEEAKKMGLNFLSFSKRYGKKNAKKETKKENSKEEGSEFKLELSSINGKNTRVHSSRNKSVEASLLRKTERILPQDVGLPEDVDYIVELEKEAKKTAALKNYNDFEGIRGRIKIVESRGLNEYQKLEYYQNMEDYMKEAELGDRMMIGAMKSKLGLISRLEPKSKTLNIKGKKDEDVDAGDDGSLDGEDEDQSGNEEEADF